MTDFVNDTTEKEQRKGSKLTKELKQQRGEETPVNIHEVRERAKAQDEQHTAKNQDFSRYVMVVMLMVVMVASSRSGYGGKYGVENDADQTTN